MNFSKFNFEKYLNMPTVAVQPTLKSTQLVGAVLMHQFARERFSQAGISEDYIQEAEESVDLNNLIEPGVCQDLGGDTNCSANESDFSIVSENSETENSANLSTSEQDITLTSQSSHHNHQPNDTTINEHYHSTAADSIHSNDNTLYHSVTNGNGNNSRNKNSTGCEINIDKLQSSPAMVYYGKQLRLLAEEFERDRKRLEVKKCADRVQLASITRENFINLIEELFEGKITREKIVVLFFFCTDVALNAASQGRELVVKLMGWSFSYIIDTFCKIIHQLGGWEHVLFRQLPSLMITCCAVLGICALTIYIRKSLRA